MSSTKSTLPLKHGEEPTALLLALVSSPLETLCQRSEVTLYTANTEDGSPGVLAFFKNTVLADGQIVLATPGSVGKDEPEAPVTANNGTSKAEK